LTSSNTTPTAPRATGNIRGYSKPKIAIRFEHGGVIYNAICGRGPDGSPAEIFLDHGHITTARLASLLLQHGVDIKTIRATVIGGPLAIVLDRIIALDSNQEDQKGE
jgi:hypothetical protein